MFFVTSWDDGHPEDERLAEILAKYSVRGTFFVPVRNREGRSVMDPAAICRLQEGFEIGSHTLSHVYLTSERPEVIKFEIEEGRRCLEQVLGRRVRGFCYPGGRYNRLVRQQVIDAGFEYARTTDNFYLDAGKDRFAVPTTLQLYRHARSIYVRNFLARGAWCQRGQAFAKCVSSEGLVSRAARIIDYVNARNGVCHIWGHSWEIARYGLWNDVEAIMKYASQSNPRFMTVGELALATSRPDR